MQENAASKPILGRYKLASLLGEGGMGSVYLAQDLQLQRYVALKMVKAEQLRQPEMRARVDNECRIMARIGSFSRIVALYDRIEYQGNVILVMEYVRGETLASVLKRLAELNDSRGDISKTHTLKAGAVSTALHTQDVIEIALQCLEAIGYVHSKGVLHCDIKPSNIMLTLDHENNLVAKLMDFGIARPVSGNTGNGGRGVAHAANPGTPAYMSPEHIDPRRFGEMSQASDLYSFGVTLFELLTKRLPFEGTYTQLLEAHLQVPPPDPSAFNAGISNDLKKVMLRALAKRPDQRYERAMDFKFDLENSRLDGGTAAAPTGWNSRHNARGRSRLLKLLPILLLLACAAAGIWGWSVYEKNRSNSESTAPSTTAAVSDESAASNETTVTTEDVASREMHELAKDVGTPMPLPSTVPVVPTASGMFMPKLITVEALSLKTLGSSDAVGEFKVSNLSDAALRLVALRIRLLDGAGGFVREGAVPLYNMNPYDAPIAQVQFTGVNTETIGSWIPVLEHVTDTSGTERLAEYSVQIVRSYATETSTPQTSTRRATTTEKPLTPLELQQKAQEYWKSKERPKPGIVTGSRSSTGKAYLNESTRTYHLNSSCPLARGASRVMTPMGAHDFGYTACPMCGR